ATGLSRGLEIDSDGVAVSGLAVVGASTGARTGIVMRGKNNRLWGDYVGLDALGQPDGNGGTGVEIDGDDNTVGGHDPEDRNLIPANGEDGLDVNGDDNLVEGNRIGLRPGSPAVAAGNGNVGISVAGDDNRIGEVADGAGNQIGANRAGVALVSGTGNELL